MKKLVLNTMLSVFCIITPLTIYGDSCGAKNDPCAKKDPCPKEDPCAPKCFPSGLKVGIDFLYWKPCIHDLDFAAVLHETNVNNGFTGNDYSYDFKSLHPKWEPGFRMYAIKENALCNLNLSGSFTWIYTICDKCKVEKPENYPIESPLLCGYLQHLGTGTFDKIEAKYELIYYSWDLLFSYPFYFCNCEVWTPYFGVAGVHSHQRLESELESHFNTKNEFCEAEVKWSALFNGLGFKAGNHFLLELCDCIKFFADASGTLTYASPCVRNKQEIEGETTFHSVRYKDHFDCHMIPGFNLKVGVVYETSLKGIDFVARFGWEFVRWFNTPTPRRFGATTSSSSIAALSSSSNTGTIGFHGLLAGVLLTF